MNDKLLTMILTALVISMLSICIEQTEGGYIWQAGLVFSGILISKLVRVVMGYSHTDHVGHTE